MNFSNLTSEALDNATRELTIRLQEHNRAIKNVVRTHQITMSEMNDLLAFLERELDAVAIEKAKREQPSEPESDLQWFAYTIRSNGEIKIKRYFDEGDLKEARDSDFVNRVAGPVNAPTRTAAALLLKKQLFK